MVAYLLAKCELMKSLKEVPWAMSASRLEKLASVVANSRCLLLRRCWREGGRERGVNVTHKYFVFGGRESFVVEGLLRYGYGENLIKTPDYSPWFSARN